MKQLIQKYALKAALLAGLLTVTAGGMALSAHLTKVRDPDAVQTVGSASAPVIVLDAGHGESTKTSSGTGIWVDESRLRIGTLGRKYAE